MKNRIIIVDDELSHIEDYKAALLRKSDQWDIEYFNDPNQAYEAIKAYPPNIVIADHKMPQMSGVDFLSKTEALHPSTERFIVADPEEKDLLDAGIGSSFHFLPKPCPADFLVSEIQRSQAIESWLGNTRTKEIVAKMGDFPSVPSMYLKVMNALNAKDAGADSIGEVISSDLAITAKIMQVVNSSYFSRSEKVSDITHAVSILGVDTVKNLALAIQVYGKLGKSDDQLALTDQLWHHSMSVAVGAKRIMLHETGDKKQAEEAYTAGLFHDVGKLVLINAVPAEYETARTLAREKKIPQWQAEAEVIGCTHADTGAYLLGRWGLPVTMVEAAALHHEPINSFGSTFSPLTAVHAANALTWERQSGDETHPDSQPDERFLNEIGRSQSWDEWRNVADGKRIEKKSSPKRPESANTSERTPSSEKDEKESASTSSIQGVVSFSELSAQSAENPISKTSKVWIAGSCIAACTAVAIILGMSVSPEADDAIEDEFASFAEDFPKAKEASTPASDDGLTEVIESAASTEVTELTEPAAPLTPIALSEEPSVAVTVDDIPDQAESETPTAPSNAPSTEPSSEVIAQTAPKTEDFPKPIIKAGPEFPSIHLTGIFYNPSNPAASVNGKIRRVGDMVAGAKIEVIEKKRITINFHGEQRSFKLQ